MSFCHLHNHDEYSQLDGLGKAKTYAKTAKELGFTHLGICNHGNVDGALRFQKACEAEGIKPIIGCELYVVENLLIKQKGDKRYHLACFVENVKGWNNLLKMLTIANLDGFYNRPRVDPKTILEHCEGLVFTTACASSVIRAKWGQQLVLELVEKLGKGKVFLEIMPHKLEYQQELNKIAFDMSKKYNLNLIAANDCHYPREDDALAQEVLLAIQRKVKWNDPNRWKFDMNDLFLKDHDEMLDAFKKRCDLPESAVIKALRRTMSVAKLCEGFHIDQMAVDLPEVPGYEGVDERKMLEELAYEGLERRITKKNAYAAEEIVYTDRLKEEIGLIIELGFERYFIIVWELIIWCKNNDILTGPGRGSVGGSLVAYCLGITDVDPIRWGLIFSRFISPARIDLPDIDMDFEDRKRHLVRKHLEDLYGHNNVAGLSTFGTMRGKAALRDVARVFDIDPKKVDSAAKSIVVRSGGDFRSDFTIEDAFDTFEDGIAFKKEFPEVVALAINLEGQIRNSGQHAAAMCISKEDLREGMRCNLATRNGVVVANWDKYDAEYFGLMKLDVLGLSSLSVLSECVDMVKKNKDINIVLDDLPLDDKKTLSMINSGWTIGLFQIGSIGLSKYCKELGVTEFNDIVNATSLWRPGTLRSGMATEFVLRKRGISEWEYPHPEIEKITKDTMGIILYQEQVMLFMYELGGLGWRTCDTVRKVISKSQGDDLFMKFKQEFAEGCVKRKTLDFKTAEKLWGELSSFGSYCLTGDTVLYRSSSNQHTDREITIKEAYEYQSDTNFLHRKLQILSMWDDERVRPNTINKIYKNGTKEVFYILTSSGKSIKATENHRFLVNDEWEDVYSIKVGDWIRCSDLNKPVNSRATGHGKGCHNTCPRFSKGEGKTNDEKNQREKLVQKYKGRCQKCSSKNRIELHHVNGSHEDNSDKNTMLLCRKCHKAEYPSSTYSRYKIGHNTHNERVVEIKSVGRRMTYDIEMIGEPRNFIANNIVSHNSFNKAHAVEYSLITYWGAYLKAHYPAEFMACTLTYGSSDKVKKNEYATECRRLHLPLELPKIGISHFNKWTTDKEGTRLFIPFGEIKGIGEKTAENISNIKSIKVPAADRAKKNKPFFIKKEDNTKKAPNKAVLASLMKMKAFSKELVTEEERNELEHHFVFDISKDPMRAVRGIMNLLEENGYLKKLVDINYQEPTKEKAFYFGQMQEVKFGYRQNVLKDAKSKKGLGDIKGTSEALGGVYGFFKDESDSSMMVFSGPVYANDKYGTEHSGDKYILVEANHPDRKASNIVCHEFVAEEDMIKCKFKGMRFDLVHENTKTLNGLYQKTKVCKDCVLHKTKGVRGREEPFLTGKYSIMIVEELPYQNKTLHKILSDFGFNSKLAHRTSIAKCSTPYKKSPTAKQAITCVKNFLSKEISHLKPTVVLAIGNTSLAGLKGEEGGIMGYNATTEWSSKHNCWICWCISPAAMRREKADIERFKKGIENFVNTVDTVSEIIS